MHHIIHLTSACFNSHILPKYALTIVYVSCVLLSICTHAKQQHLEEFACEGLRTLVLSTKVISQSEYEAWRTDFKAAQEVCQPLLTVTFY
jgi:hypothetical protein